jgi:hypothetical protein
MTTVGRSSAGATITCQRRGGAREEQRRHVSPGTAATVSCGETSRAVAFGALESPAHRWRALVQQTLKSYRNWSALVAQCRCLELPRAVSGCLAPAATFFHRPGDVGASRSCLWSEGGDCSPRTMIRSYARRERVSSRCGLGRCGLVRRPSARRRSVHRRVSRR